LADSDQHVVGGHEPPAASAPGGGLVDPPRWLLMTALIAGGAVLSLGFAGLSLAVIGLYLPVPAFLLGAALIVGMTVLVRPTLTAPRHTPRTAQIAAAVGIGAILAITLWNGANSAQHVLINRDGGVYANAGRWLARDGSLEVAPGAGPFRNDPKLEFESVGIPENHGTLQFQGAHLLPALLAESHAVAGDAGMFRVPSLLGGIALLEFFALAWRLFRRPVFAVAAMLALAFILPEVSFSRDTYTEITTQIFVFTALWLLVDRQVLPHWRAALAAGLFIGAIQATRIDAALVVVGLPIVVLVAWLHARSESDRRGAKAAGYALLAGLVPGCMLGVIDLVVRSSSYWQDQWSNERSLIVVTLASATACAVLAALWSRVSPTLSKLPWNTISWIAAVLVLVAAFGAWFVRPSIQEQHHPALAALQEGGRMVVRYTTNEFEGSMQWMAWYLGPLTLSAAIVGGALLARALLRGRMLYTVAPVALLLPGSLLYLWDARAFADHVWVTRRFLTAAFPMLILLALGLAASLWRPEFPRRFSTWARAIGAVIAVAAVAFPLYTLAPVRSMEEQAGYLSAIQTACRTLGRRAAVVVLIGPTMASPDVREDWLPQALRGWCGTRVTMLALDIDAQPRLLDLAERWSKRNRRFFVVASGPEPIQQVLPDAQVTLLPTVVNRHLLEQTFDHRPSSYERQTFPVAVAQVVPRPR
jgi:hypothetical protein